MRPVKILIVDDDPEQVEILQTILKAEGREVQTCTKGKEALDLVRKNQYDIVFTDISMPEVDGIEVMKFTKENSPKTEVIPITAFGDWDLYAKTLRMGAKEFINKPFNIPEIQRVVERLSV